jgi:hypothetical protein
MNTVLILYPDEFQSQSKFDRKIGNIVSKMEEFCIAYLSDKNYLIENYIEKCEKTIKIIKIERLEIKNFTHAIIFDDGEVFPKEREIIEKLNVPLRHIKIAITRVVNIKKETKYAATKSTNEYEYIGRGSYWGNPYSMFSAGESREEVIRKFKYDFDFEKFAKKEKNEVYLLAGKRLGCFCKPDACHGDVLADFLNKWDDGE